ncbi:hypothetical protein B0H16DRAFT_1475056 [Mycena metata]|uniref:Uncharacterized protein n=1 Tax=Mycena metata TaxID=1033252 RepID=A0AAD7H9S8_9AGAR|nr:hypothetical protein B0H16DRAFT_1477146 [Mycena metata]KAJ7719319.1 hypothetical protein B0H16DRAFT_1475056 [Mycena metata]
MFPITADSIWAELAASEPMELDMFMLSDPVPITAACDFDVSMVSDPVPFGANSLTAFASVSTPASDVCMLSAVSDFLLPRLNEVNAEAAPSTHTTADPSHSPVTTCAPPAAACDGNFGIDPAALVFDRSAHQTAAIRTLQACLNHHDALREHHAKLEAEMAEVDRLLREADPPADDSDDEETENPVFPLQGLIQDFDDQDSPFYEDAQRRNRYLACFSGNPMSPEELKALTKAVEVDSARVAHAEGTVGKPQPATLLLKKLDWTLVANQVSESSPAPRTAEECRREWSRLPNGAVNRGVWETREIRQLVRLVEEYDGALVNWVRVAADLETNRVPLDCLRQWLIENPRPDLEWTPELDLRLQEAVVKYGQCWSHIARYVDEKATVDDCWERYVYVFQARRGCLEWSEEEDRQLRVGLEAFGGLWEEAGFSVQGRSVGECQERAEELGLETAPPKRNPRRKRLQRGAY